ncbi:MAG: hypothetical protein IJA20_03080 [Methanocorpusculum sp.]|nr:hypothetical protein [Methanocorpusculum sp.]
MSLEKFNDFDANGLNDSSQGEKNNKFDLSDSDELAEQLERQKPAERILSDEQNNESKSLDKDELETILPDNIDKNISTDEKKQPAKEFNVPDENPPPDELEARKAKEPEEKQKDVAGNDGGGSLKPLETAEKEKHYENPKLNGVEEITAKHCDRAREIAQNSSDNGANYTDHNLAHWRETETQTGNVAVAVEKAVESGSIYKDGYVSNESRVPFGKDIDREVLSAAALSHDTGMSDDGYSLAVVDGEYQIKKQDPNNFNSVRDNHSLNSAINVLESRDAYRELGFNDSQIDTIAAECMAHSKSNSGVRDLNSRSDWSECFDRMDAVVDRYNDDHLDSKISFNRKAFEENSEELSNLASASLCLRAGDVSRSSGSDSVTQSGETIHVTPNDNPSTATSWETEINNYTVMRSDGCEVTGEKSKQVHIGEQNIIENHTYINDNGYIQHTVTVADGNHAPYCTQRALEDHLGEFASAKDGQFVVAVEFDKSWEEPTRKAYENWRTKLEDEETENATGKNYPNVDIHFPWDD